MQPVRLPSRYSDRRTLLALLESFAFRADSSVQDGGGGAGDSIDADFGRRAVVVAAAESKMMRKQNGTRSDPTTLA